MRIGYFSSISEWGGSESYLLSLITGIRDKGHEAVFFGIEDSWLWEKLEKENVERVAWRQGAGPGRVRGLPEGGTAGKTLPNWKHETGSIKRFVLGMAPGWVKLLAGNAAEIRLLREIFRQHRVSVMHVAVHGYEVAGLACHEAGIPSLAMNMVLPPEERYWFRRRLMRYTACRSDHVSSQSRACTEAWIKMAGLDRRRCSFVWNGADPDRFACHSERSRMAGQPFRVISAGRLHPMKGFRHLVKAMSLVGAETATLEILGEGNQRPELETMVRQLGLQERVFLPGHVPALETKFANADCFVLASVSHESGPAVLAEAMLSGLPLITSDFGPLPELNEDGLTGLVVSAAKHDELAAAITRLAGDPATCRKMGLAGQEKARRSLSRQSMIENTLALYREVASDGE